MYGIRGYLELIISLCGMHQLVSHFGYRGRARDQLQLFNHSGVVDKIWLNCNKKVLNSGAPISDAKTSGYIIIYSQFDSL